MLSKLTLKSEFASLRVAAFSTILALTGSYLVQHFCYRLPPVRLAELSKTAQPYQQQCHFSSDWFSHNIPVWEKACEPFRGKPDTRYLEVGVYEGRSAIWMLENILTDPSAHVTALDLFSGDLKENFLANVRLSGGEKKVTAIAGPSQETLRRMPLRSFDIVYINGSHAADDVLEDAVLCWRLLKEGGILIFDDYLWTERDESPKPAIDVFYKFYGKHFDVIHNDYQVILKKKRRD